jgi:nuclease-like protein
VLHDLAIPGSQANIDHLVIGPGGVAVIDSKQYRGRLRLDSYGLLWHGRRLLVSALRKVRWEADQADEVLGVADIQVADMIALHGASLPWGRLDTDGVTVAPALCLTCSRPCRPSLGPSGWPVWRTGPGYAFALPPNPGPATANWTDRPGVTYRSLIAASPQLRQAWPVCRGHGQALLRMAGSRRRCLSLTHAPTSCELGRIHRPARLTAVSRGIPEGAASAGIALRWEVV